ncbi:hypothetical protein BDBG_16168 [Blastomyces gilchristii SLH14081]|uniref:Uncharacterized protein n=1 Tax=Blastomyces gilchristii (strain SLH14081) TaxID=559298 RepID=A0A179U7V1_BLAGS|nr:uncharacterized protein BDBG_16168 [Blastomyces gilchristii SLH14081]OAT04034.1 hypothetical protein BDBG_16168 [Blastomyces gilchristii SLH14081]
MQSIIIIGIRARTPPSQKSPATHARSCQPQHSFPPKLSHHLNSTMTHRALQSRLASKHNVILPIILANEGCNFATPPQNRKEQEKKKVECNFLTPENPISET